MREWCDEFSEEEEREVAALKARLRELGARTPDRRVRGGVLRNYALVAEQILARQVWLSVGRRWLRSEPEEWWPWIDFEQRPDPPTDPDDAFELPAYAMRRILAAGADPADLKEVVRSAVSDAMVSVMNLVNQGRLADRPELPGWRLMEVDASGELTGRVLGDLVNGWVDANPWRERRPDDEEDAGGGDEADGEPA